MFLYQIFKHQEYPPISILIQPQNSILVSSILSVMSHKNFRIFKVHENIGIMSYKIRTETICCLFEFSCVRKFLWFILFCQHKTNYKKTEINNSGNKWKNFFTLIEELGNICFFTDNDRRRKKSELSIFIFHPMRKKENQGTKIQKMKKPLNFM